MYDVVISGAGPAGSKCAEILARNGFKVALIEKDTNWRKPCGGAVNSRIFKYYPQLRNFNFHPISGMKIYSADYHNFGYKWKKPSDYSINVDRLEFDNVLRNIAIDSGADLFDKNLSYDFIFKNNKRIGVRTKSSSGTKEFKGKIIVIADGMSSRLAHKSGLKSKWKSEDIMYAKCAIMEGKNNIDPEIISFYFQPYKGYGWLFPLEGNRFNIGCGILGIDAMRYHLNQFYNDFLQDPYIKKFLPESKYKTIWTGAYPLPGRGVYENSLYGENILLVGDVAGFVSPLSGEGICSGTLSGKIAAETAIKAIEKEEISKKTLKNYKTHPTIKKLSRSYKLTKSLIDFCFDNNGQNLSNMFKIAESDEDFRERMVEMFLFSKAPPKDFIMKINTEN
ncbi:MAG: geranylgeranyl reductase family protein [Promethearchaeota archaeon]